MLQRFQHNFKSPLPGLLFWWGPSAEKESNSHNCLILCLFSWVYFLKVEKSCCLTHYLGSGHVTGHWQARGSSVFGSGVPSWPTGCVQEYRAITERGSSHPRPIRWAVQMLNHAGVAVGLGSDPNLCTSSVSLGYHLTELQLLFLCNTCNNKANVTEFLRKVTS